MKNKLTLIALLALASPPVRAGFFGGSTQPHGHTGPADGGTLTAPVLTNVTATNVTATTLSSGTAGNFGSLTDRGLTSGRVTFASTSVLLADSSNLAWDNTNKFLTLAGSPRLQLNGATSFLGVGDGCFLGGNLDYEVDTGFTLRDNGCNTHLYIDTLNTPGTESSYISGKFGVNTPAPSTMLDVTGSFRVTNGRSSFYANGEAYAVGVSTGVSIQGFFGGATNANDTLISNSAGSEVIRFLNNRSVDIPAGTLSASAAVTAGTSMSAGTTLTVGSTVTFSAKTLIILSSAPSAATWSTDSTRLISSWSETLDSNSEFNGTTFTVTNTGYYNMTVRADFSDSGSGSLDSAALYVYKNGSVLYSDELDLEGLTAVGGFSFASRCVPPMATSLSVGDTITFKFFASTSSGSGNFGLANIKASIERILK